MIGEHHRGFPGRSPFPNVTTFDLAMAAGRYEGRHDGPGRCVGADCGCRRPGRITAHWRPEAEDPSADVGGDERIGLVIYMVCGRCWDRMRRDEEFTARVEASIVAGRPSEWETLP
jgi:hypothetical protein